MVKENLRTVEERIMDACIRSGRSRKEVTLIAVSKTKPVSMIHELMEEGIIDFGENKVQEMCRKIEEIQSPLQWHLIGHLQRNKVKYVIGQTYLIHSVDSLSLASEIEKEAGKKQVEVPVLIEINIGNEDSKFGIDIQEAVDLVIEAAKLPHIRIKGLMCIAPFVEDPEENRDCFRKMRELKEKIAGLNLPRVEMKELSMGMTGDFEVAIEEGATMVRVGTAIFGERQYPVS